MASLSVCVGVWRCVCLWEKGRPLWKQSSNSKTQKQHYIHAIPFQIHQDTFLHPATPVKINPQPLLYNGHIFRFNHHIISTWIQHIWDSKNLQLKTCWKWQESTKSSVKFHTLSWPLGGSECSLIFGSPEIYFKRSDNKILPVKRIRRILMFFGTSLDKNNLQIFNEHIKSRSKIRPKVYIHNCN